MTLPNLSRWFSKPIDVCAELAQVPREAESMAYRDGRRESPCAAPPAMLALRLRGGRLMYNVTTTFGADLERTHQGLGDELQRYEQIVRRLPETLRLAKRHLDEHLRELDSQLLQAARQAVESQRTLRAEEMQAGRTFSSTDAGSSSVLAAALLVAVAVEVLLSSLLTADNNPGGFLSSLVLFGTLTAVNYTIAFQSGVAVRALWDGAGATARIAAGALMVVFLVSMVSLHAVVAKFRELTLSGSSFEAAMSDAVGAVRDSFPTELSSLIIGMIGLLCGLGAFACGYRQVAARRVERESGIAADAERALRQFDLTHQQCQSTCSLQERALAELDALDAEVETARAALATALQAWVSRRNHLGALQDEIVRVHDDAAELYEACVSKIRSRESADRCSSIGLIPVRRAADSGYFDAARRVLQSTSWAQELESARAEIHLYGAALDVRMAGRLAKWDESLYNDRGTDGRIATTRGNAPDPKLVPATMQ